jgi:hypothetical protein
MAATMRLGSAGCGAGGERSTNAALLASAAARVRVRRTVGASGGAQ